MSFFKRWYGKLRLGEDPQVAYTTASNGEASVTVKESPSKKKTWSPLRSPERRPSSPLSLGEGSASEGEDEEELETLEGGEGSDDDKSLIVPEEPEIDSNGVVREYEVALKHLGFGLFHICLLFVNGLGLLSDAIEVLSLSFVLPILRNPEEFGASDGQEAILSSIIFVGMLFGSYIWGGLADVIGRRTTIVCSLSVSAVFGFASAFSPWFWLFIVLRLLSGFGVGGSLPVIFPYTSEFIRNKYRGPYLGIQSTFWMVGRLLCGGFAWAIIPTENIDTAIGDFRFHSWRLFLAISALPSLIGALMYFLLPESPRFLLEIGKHKKAMNALRFAHKLNHICDRGETKEYPVKTILLENKDLGLYVGGKNKLKLTLLKIKEVLYRTLELFTCEYWRRTPLLLVIMFCLSFGGYGVTLWYPTYIADVTAQNELERFEAHCNNTINLTSLDVLKEYCDCSQTIITDSDFTDTRLEHFKINDVVFSNVAFNKVNFESVVFNGTQFIDCEFHDTNFSQSAFNFTIFENVLFDSVSIQSSSLCSLNGSSVEIRESSMVFEDVDVNGEKIKYGVYNSTEFDMSVLNQGSFSNCSENSLQNEIQCKPPDYRVYRDSFFVSASAFPGNIASAIAVYFLRRNYWLAFSLFVSTITVFLLYVESSELFVVIVLCVFTAVSTPAWNDSSLLIAELYPTRLRSTAAGIHLLCARIGAICGTNIFGAFIRVNPSVPIIFVAVVLFVGAVTALGLPKTTRKTLLK